MLTSAILVVSGCQRNDADQPRKPKNLAAKPDADCFRALCEEKDATEHRMLFEHINKLSVARGRAVNQKAEAAVLERRTKTRAQSEKACLNSLGPTTEESRAERFVILRCPLPPSRCGADSPELVPRQQAVSP